MNPSEFHRKLSKEDDYSILIRLPILTLSSWLFQGMLYMDQTEKHFKLLLDVLLFICLYIIINSLSEFSNYIVFLASILIAHTLNWVFNGQIFVLLKNLKLIKNDSYRFFQYVDDLQSRIENEQSIQSAATYGSLSRNSLKETSDLDVRIIRKSGTLNGIKACFFVLLERSRGLISRFPIDIFVLDSTDSLGKLNDDEPPIILYNSDNTILEFYKNKVVKFWKL